MKLKALILSALMVMSTGIAYSQEGHNHTAEVKSIQEEALSEFPAQIKSAFPEAKSISLKHTGLSKKQVSDIEKWAGMKMPEPHFHTYIAYGTKNGKKAQLGAATFVENKGAIFYIVYNNDITIKKIITVKGLTELDKAGFLKAFSGKNHDQAYKIGKDLKYTGTKKADAQAFATAVKMNILTMEALYGKPHSH